MKKIYLSLAIILAVGGIIWGATTAFYNDTETSNGNIFTAGSIDLKVDHLKQSYNGDDCETCNLTLYSAAGNTNVVDKSANAVVLTALPFLAPAITNPHTAWATNPPAQWIWASPATLVGDDGSTGLDVSYTFEREFLWWGTPVGVNLDINIGADNSYELFLNGESITANSGNNYNPLDTLNSTEKAEFISELEVGNNVLTIVVTNHYNPQNNGAYNNPAQNPGGLLYNLTIERDSETCEANSEFQQACMLWTATDLTDQKFFNFGDIKPEDEGTNLISLHVSTNDAYICLLPQVTNDENGVVNPEVEAGDDLLNGPGNGELQDELEFFGWDDDGDGVYQNGENTLIQAGTSLADIQSNMISMSLATSTTGYIGLAWCAGTQTVTGSSIDCDGNGMSNKVQTDQAMADLTAYAVQQRNNENFSCADVVLP
jgi:predicted ribosomally synthesized peptide with SipW-like signal peptide